MLLLTKPTRPRIIATILAKNEADIIGANIEHHIEQGVSQFIVTNNQSQDETAQIAARYKEVVEIIDEPDDTHNQSISVTRMARLACKLNPDWIVHLDADELWTGFDVLPQVKKGVLYSTKAFIHPPRSTQPFSVDAWRYYLDIDDEIAGEPGDTKVVHRPNPEIEILHGNHGVKGCRDFSLTSSLCRHHYSVRTYQHFENKVVKGYEAMRRRGTSCDRWEIWYAEWQQGRLLSLYESIVSAWELFLGGEHSPSRLERLLKFWAPEHIANILKTRKLEVKQWPTLPS